MKVNFHIDQDIDEEHAEFYVKNLTERLQEIANSINADNQILWGFKDKDITPLQLDKVASIRTQNNKVIAETVDRQVFILKQKLYMLNDLLPGDFIKVSQSEIINYKSLDHLEVSNNGMINLILKNGHTAFASRRFVASLKRRLGL
ncbi:LytTR family transcriptional regulator DNA-binding domain-containing protein [Paucilactobacillus suebicus]|uniref:HTH LytTR-type domain-containing protein n=1 Tax=Paucilactobacillus suebicus DSM 5007 = KCTC 3549 TaxID=1423807 RepID=A0A0R1W2X6_9LACO|nr:LytTR family transcriptional regulator DNA-binding domain-containing protein [Paucilactobacillus suebicus]KRM09897.1 hypothetical protein FD16_GL001491 [Paucilactobacillus suebicus DSM 5007 = KCTC 3549]